MPSGYRRKKAEMWWGSQRDGREEYNVLSQKRKKSFEKKLISSAKSYREVKEDKNWGKVEESIGSSDGQVIVQLWESYFSIAKESKSRFRKLGRRLHAGEMRNFVGIAPLLWKG